MNRIAATIIVAVCLIQLSADSLRSHRNTQIDPHNQRDSFMQQVTVIKASDISHKAVRAGRLNNDAERSVIEQQITKSSSEEEKTVNTTKPRIDIAGYGVIGSRGLRFFGSNSSRNTRTTPSISIRRASRETTDEIPEPPGLADPVFEYSLRGNHPNPFNPSTTISFTLPESEEVKLSIYNIRGQLVRTLVDDVLNKGEHTIIWNGRDENNREVSSGVYFYVLKSAIGVDTRRMMLMK